MTMSVAANDPLNFEQQPVRTKAPTAPRHPLGLPAGSVRATIAMMVAGLIWALVLTAKEQTVEIPLYLCYLLFLIVGSFFASHGSSIAGNGSAGPSPWHLPSGTFRFLLILGFFGVFGWRTYSRGELPEIKVTHDLSEHAYLLVWILGAFFLGMLMTRLVAAVSSGGTPAWYQDVLAWVSLLALIGLVIEVAVLLMINPTLEGEKINLPKWQTFLSAILGLYFGART